MYPWQLRYGRNTLKRGMSGAFVTALQEDLGKAGFPTGGIDGIFGGNTETAVRNFQKSMEYLDIDGQAGQETKKALYAATHA